MKPVILVLGPSGLDTARNIQLELLDAEIHGYIARVDGVDQAFESIGDHLRALFEDGRPIIGLCSAAILIRCLAPVLSEKRAEPPVVAVAEDGTAVIPLLGGHNGANDLARKIGAVLGKTPAITTAGDLRFGATLDTPPDGYVLANRADAKQVMARILAGEAVDIRGRFSWLDAGRFQTSKTADIKMIETITDQKGAENALVYHPKRLVLGVGCERGCPPELLNALVDSVLNSNNLSRHSVACVVSLDVKADEPAMHELARSLNVPARFYGVDAINAIEDKLPNPSEIVRAEVGVPGVAEGASLAAAGEGGRLLVEKTVGKRCTVAITETEDIVDPGAIGCARGRLTVVGLGPGTADWRSPEATRSLREATDWVGYGLYLDLATDLSVGKTEHRFDLGKEEDRVRHALLLAGEGKNVALICSGDAGIYAMGALVLEIVDPQHDGGALPDAARRVEVVMVPGISAFQAAAARIGAPIGHDFCCISLSDLLTPWKIIERRIGAAAEGDFVVAFYNPRSMRRHEQIVRAMAILAEHRSADTPVLIASNLGRDGERLLVRSLRDFNPEEVDMLSLVLVGSTESRTFLAGDGIMKFYTPRGYAAKTVTA